MVLVNRKGRSASYEISWGEALARVDYFGEIQNRDIESAHFSLNGDGRFYECNKLILNVSDCSLAKVDVPELLPVIATDLGASQSIAAMKVAMIASDSVNIERVDDYINRSKVSPWKFKLFSTLGGAEQWLNA